MSFIPGDVLLVPVAFSDGSGRKKRPVVVIYAGGDADLLVAPVTSQAERSPHDVRLVRWQQAGLRLPSIVRVEKLATVEKSIVLRRMGRLAPEDWSGVRDVLKELLEEILR